MQESPQDAGHPIFLFGFHRGGTTFVQRLLNCHRAVTVWGENGGLLTRLREIHRVFETSAQPFDPAEYGEFTSFATRFVPWASPVDTEDVAGRLRALVHGIYGSASAPFWGFKEIRHNNIEDIAFAFSLFPEAHVVALVRHPRAVLMSDFAVGWSSARAAQRLDDYVTSLLRGYARGAGAFVEAKRRWPQRVHFVHVEALQDPATARTIFQELSLDPAGIDQGLVAEVVRTRAGSSFGDAGRQVGEDQAAAVARLYEELVSSVIAAEAGADSREILRGWYPDV